MRHSANTRLRFKREGEKREGVRTTKLSGSTRWSWQVPEQPGVVEYVLPAQSPQNVMSAESRLATFTDPFVLKLTEDQGMVVEVLEGITCIWGERRRRGRPCRRFGIPVLDVLRNGHAIEVPYV